MSNQFQPPQSSPQWNPPDSYQPGPNAQPFPYYQPVSQEPKPSRKVPPAIGLIPLGVIVVIVLVTLIIAHQASPGSQPITSPQSFTGNGAQNTSTFTVSSPWNITWSCDPSSFDSIQYNVIIDIHNADGSLAAPATINSLCNDGNTGGTTEEYQSGTFYLAVNSEAAWSITVAEG